MELNELYDIIGTAIMIITEIFVSYCVIKLVKIFLYLKSILVVQKATIKLLFKLLNQKLMERSQKEKLLKY